jgi:hypothetical protein
MASLIQRAIGAARLEPGTYEEVEADAGAFGQAMTVVVIAAIAGGIGSAGVAAGHGPGLIGGTVASLIGWFVWAFTVYVVGTRILPGPETKADLGQLLRTTGFAASPGTARILGIVPGIGGLVMAVTALWQLAAMVVAVRAALDYSTTSRAIAVCVIGFVAQMLVFIMVLGSTAALLGVTGPVPVAP